MQMIGEPCYLQLFFVFIVLTIQFA